MKHLIAAAALALMAGPSFAQDDAGRLEDLVNNSIGYANIDEGVLLIEDDLSSSICKIDISDAFFFGYQSGDAAAMDGARPSVICVPTPDLVSDASSNAGGEIPGLDTMVDESIGYVNIAPGVLLIEDDISSHICRIQINDTYFLAYATGNADGRRSAAPTVICVPTPEVAR